MSIDEGEVPPMNNLVTLFNVEGSTSNILIV